MIVRAVKVCISFVVSVSDRSRKYVARRLGRDRPAQSVVLYYHAVRSVDREGFRWQMEELSRISIPFGLADEAAFEPGRLYVAVTFDDAFESVVENALPVLRSKRIPCTIFTPTGSMGGRPAWLRSGHPDAQETVASSTLIRMLSSDALVTIGSHSVTHPDFKKLDDRTALLELTKSRSALEAVVEQPVVLFSFPHGSFADRSLELARQAGYKRVYTIEPTIAAGSRDEFACGRVKVDPTDWPVEFRLKATGAYRWVPIVSRWKRRARGWLPQALRMSPGHAPGRAS